MSVVAEVRNMFVSESYIMIGGVNSVGGAGRGALRGKQCDGPEIIVGKTFENINKSCHGRVARS